MTQYPAATPKANAAMIVSRSRMEKKKAVIRNVLLEVRNCLTSGLAALRFAAKSSILMIPMYLALTACDIDH